MNENDIVQQLMSRIQELENKQAQTERQIKNVFEHISEIYKSKSIEETLEVLGSLAQNKLETENAKVYCVDSRTDKMFAIQDGELIGADNSDEIIGVKETQTPLIKENTAYIPVTDKDDKVMCVVVAENANIDSNVIEQFQSDGDIGSVFKLAFSKEKEAQVTRTDQLTNIENRHGMKHYTEKRMLKDINMESPVQVIMIDIDKFKNFNDTYGHLAGDKVLKNTANLLEDNLRENDRVFRFGGEEMTIIMNGISTEDAYKRADELRELVANTPVDIGDGNIVTVTVSMGIAEVPFEGADVNEDNIHQVLEKSIDEADKNLYIAKKNGRNRVIASLELNAEKTTQSENTGYETSVNYEDIVKKVMDEPFAYQSSATEFNIDDIIEKATGDREADREKEEKVSQIEQSEFTGNSKIQPYASSGRYAFTKTTLDTFLSDSDKNTESDCPDY